MNKFGVGEQFKCQSTEITKITLLKKHIERISLELHNEELCVVEKYSHQSAYILLNMLKKLNWEAYASDERNKVIETVKDCIATNDGCIMNFNMFSDLALSLSIEIEENRIIDLYKALSILLKLSDFDEECVNLKSKKECLLFLYISFIHGKGDLKKEIPNVPG